MTAEVGRQKAETGALPVLLAFRPEVSVTELSERQVNVEAFGTRVVLKNVTPGLLAAIRRLASRDGATADALADEVLDGDDATSLASLYYQIENWRDLRYLQYSVRSSGQRLISMVPIAHGFQVRTDFSTDAHFQLSRFAYTRRDGDELILESPVSPVRTVLHGPGAGALFATLTQPHTAAEVAKCAEDLENDAVIASVQLLLSARLLCEVGEEGVSAEDQTFALRSWDFHDLLFHARNRIGRHEYPHGATYRFLDEVAPLRALKPAMSDVRIPLYRPDPNLLGADDPPLARLMESRKSIREYGASPISVRQLGELLYRVARVTGEAPNGPAPGALYEVAPRPYPSGGAVYELELYLTVNRCEGLEAGIYHYDPLGHLLEQLALRNADLNAMLDVARQSAGMNELPQVLVTLASRFQRLSWKYSGMAYATTLKDVGVLYEVMYLVATAMGLAPCALGAGDSDCFARATGVNYYEESSVGEFLLGSHPD